MQLQTLSINHLTSSTEVQKFLTHHICEEKSGVTELEMLEEAVESEAVEAAPGAVEILPGLGLLPAVVVVQELVNYPGHLQTKLV